MNQDTNPSPNSNQRASPSKQGVLRAAQEYCTSHRNDFAKFLNGQAIAVSLTYWMIPVLGMALTILWNAKKAGLGPVLLSLIPLAAFTLAGPMLNFFTSSRAMATKWAFFCVEAGLAGFVFSTIVSTISAVERGFEITSGPVQAILLAVGSVTFLPSYRLMLFRNVMIATASYLAMAMTVPTFAENNSGQFIGGLAVGSLFGYLYFRSQEMVFYTKAILSDFNENLLLGLKRLVYPHQVQMLSVGEKIEDTMATGRKTAYIGEFDIIGSSRVTSSDFHAMVGEAFAACFEMMMESYELNFVNPAQPYCDGYKLKELGDGFIYSVDHPFLVRPGVNPAGLAVDLGRRFLEQFDTRATARGWTEPIKACVCLGKGELTGFWSTSPVFGFDFEQDGVRRVSIHAY